MTTITPVSAFLPTLPVQLPAHEPRQSSVVSWHSLSDLQPDDAEGQGDNELFPFPYGPRNEMKWLTAKEIIADLITTKGYDNEFAGSLVTPLHRYSYQHVHVYYEHKRQAKRNKKKELARKLAEQLVGTQTPPPSDETPTPQE